MNSQAPACACKYEITRYDTPKAPTATEMVAEKRVNKNVLFTGRDNERKAIGYTALKASHVGC